MDKSSEGLPALENDELAQMVRSMLRLVVKRGREKVSSVAQDGRKQLELRSLRKDRVRLYEKLGKEVEQLIQAGEIEHIGLERGLERIRTLEKELQRLEALSTDEPPASDVEK
jgi:hypothetical protein